MCWLEFPGAGQGHGGRVCGGFWGWARLVRVLEVRCEQRRKAAVDEIARLPVVLGLAGLGRIGQSLFACRPQCVEFSLGRRCMVCASGAAARGSWMCGVFEASSPLSSVHLRPARPSTSTSPPRGALRSLLHVACASRVPRGGAWQRRCIGRPPQTEGGPMVGAWGASHRRTANRSVQALLSAVEPWGLLPSAGHAPLVAPRRQVGGC